jgi:hypothetical protein
MKKLLFILFIPLFVNAQTDSVKVSFSEEKVEKFEKTTLMDEYDKAFGVNRKVNAALKLGLDFAEVNTNNLFINYEKKIGKAFSMNLGVRTGKINPETSRIMLEPRWYFKMKKRMDSGLQGNNLNGDYLGIRFDSGSEEANYTFGTSLNYTFLYGTRFIWGIPFGFSSKRESPFSSLNRFTLNYGKQFGKTVDFTLSLGYQTINEQVFTANRFSTIFPRTKTGGYGYGFERASTWFLSSNTRLSLGVFLPIENREELSYKCDFLLCNYDVKRLLKLNMSQLFYIDKYGYKVFLNGEYEIKLGKLPLSLNTAVTLDYNMLKNVAIKSYRDTIINGYKSRVDYVFEKERVENHLGTVKISEQLRYYVGMKNRVRKGKSANNLSGLYLGFAANYLLRYEAEINPNSVNYFRITDDFWFDTSKFSYNFSIGYQRQTAKNAFIDYGFRFQRRKTYFIDIDGTSKTSKYLNSNFYLKFGIAR